MLTAPNKYCLVYCGPDRCNCGRNKPRSLTQKERDALDKAFWDSVEIIDNGELVEDNEKKEE